MNSIIDEIKAKIDIVELVSEHIQLRAVGKNFRGLCPFHQEKVPSFYVSPERQIWHCFGQCNDGGDIFKFIMKLENVEFPEALRILAKKAGVELKTSDYHLTSQRTKLLDILKLAKEFYHKILLESPLASQARAYLKKRQLQDKTINDFQLGFALDRNNELLKFLTKKGFKEQDIELAGLIILNPKLRNQNLKYYDRFRNRIVFPINDVYGNIVGFTGRIIPEAETKEVAKYINTPETPVYNKSRLLYGLDKTKEAIKKSGFAILVEGNMDVIAAYQSGTKNVVASSGTALTLEQIKLLKRYTNNLILAFDVDLAGQAATQRGIDIALGQEMNIKVLRLPQGKDPDECIRKNPKEWLLAIKKAQPIMDYYFQLAFENRRKDNLDDKKVITSLLLPQIAKLGNLIEQDHWLKVLSERLNVPEAVLRESLAKIKLYPIKKKRESAPQPKPSVEQLTAERLLALVLRFPQLCIQYFIDLPLGVFEGQSIIIAKNIFDCYEAEKLVDLRKIQEKITDDNLIVYLDYLLLLAEKEFLKTDKKEIEKEVRYLSKRLKYWWLSKKMTELVKNLKIAESNRQKDKIEELTEEIKKITQALAELNNKYDEKAKK